MYKAIRYFTDLKDGSYPYHPGDEFPREGLQVSEERIQDLLTGNNRRGIPVIEQVEEPKKVKKPIEKEVVAEVATEAADEPVQKAEESAAKPKRGRKKKNAD